MSSLKGRVALVTGAGRGIGSEIARRLAVAGAEVVLADIDLPEAEAAAASVNAQTGRGVAMKIDIGSDSAVAMFADAVGRRFGHCDILVNNAAVLDSSPIDQLTMERYRRVADINLDGAIRMSIALVPLLRKGGRERRIVNISSVMGLLGRANSVPYSTAKGGIVNFTRALACDLAPDGILVNCVAPGYVDTRMALEPDGVGHQHKNPDFLKFYIAQRRIPLARPAQPADIAGPVLFLCSDDCRYMTGQTLVVDGGLTATF